MGLGFRGLGFRVPGFSPKGTFSYVVDTWAPKYLYGDPFGPSVYTIYLP